MRGELVVVETARDRQVARAAAAPVLQLARARPTVGLVDGDRHHPGLLGEGVLDAVAVMGVEIDIGDARRAQREKLEEWRTRDR